MPFFERNGRIVLFVHIPKTGGSSIEAHLKNYSRAFFYCSQRPLPAATKISPQHYSISSLKSIFGGEFWDVSFSIVRNPLHRVISEYHYQRKFFWPNIPPIDKWIDIVLRAARDDPFYLDNHLRPQVDFLDDSVKVFKYENDLNKIIINIEKLMGFTSNQELPKILKFDHPQICLNNKSIDTIARFYERDFKILNYPIIP